MAFSRLRAAASFAAALLVLTIVWSRLEMRDRESAAPRAETAVAASRAQNQRPERESVQASSDERATVPTAQLPAFNAFDRWTAEYRDAAAERKTALVDEGISLARQRRTAIKELISTNPREALARAVPMTVRQDLPAEVVALLEERISARGFYGVKGVFGGDGTAIRREVRLADNARYDAFVYGRRTRQASTENAYLSGIAVDDTMAVDERPLRVLETGERPDTRKQVSQVCPISGTTTLLDRANNALPPITDETPAVELGGTIQYLCSGGHILAVEDDAIAQEGSTGGAGKPTGGIPSTWNTGPKTHLYIRITFPDQLTDPQHEKSCYDMMKSVNDFMLENSFGKCYFLTTVTPVLVLPRTEAWYKQEDDDSAVLADARLIAKAAGYDPAQFDFDTVRYNGGPGSFGGQAYVRGKGCWLKSSGVGVACHEYGHNLGLWHANYWNTAPASIIGPGTNTEYGNTFDTMGSANAGNNHYGAYNKNVINWLTNELITNVTASGTYRIFAFDQLTADPARRYALKIKKDTDRNYWAEFRQKFTTNTWMMSGLQLTWDAWGDDGATGSNGGPQLLDTTPGSPDGKNDAQLIIGRTFSDFESGIHMTPIGKGGTTPESVDVVVNLGTFPSNQAPTLSLSGSTTTAATNAQIPFTAVASDPDADSLAFAWDFGDRTFSTTNAAVVSKSWSVAGSYVVRCTVSDMKGKVASSYVVVTVGSPATFGISGRVTAGGEPLEGVLVSNGQTGTAYRGTYTDSDGSYTIANVTAGSTTVTVQLSGYTFTPAFPNPVAVGPSATSKDFTAIAGPTLSITAVDSLANESGDPARFRITRTGSTAASVTVRLFAPSGTATRTSDYTLSPDPLANLGVYEVSMPAGSATLDIVLTPVNDTAQEGPETMTLQLVPLAGFAIAGPQSATVILDDNDTLLPRVSITVPDEYANEGGDPAQFVISRTGSTTSPLTVQFARSGTATNGSDYANINTSIVIPAGTASVPLVILPIDDSAVEGNETVTLTVSTNAAYVRDSTAQAATATINDNDVNVLTVAATDDTASESGDLGTFTITRTGDLTSALTVDHVLGGTALHGIDYQKLSGAATIRAGEASTTVTVVPIDDDIGEPQQTVILQLRSGTSSQLGSAVSATVNLSDNDLPSVSVNATDGTALEPTSGSGTDTAKFRIYRNGGIGAFTADYTISGTAKPGSDFTAVSGNVAFAAADASKDIVVTALADADFEDTETVNLTLTPNASVYRVEPENTATVQILDADQVAVSVSTEDVIVTEASASMRFWVSRSGSTTNELVVSIQMSGSASEGVDYTAPPSTVSIPAGQAGVYVSLPIFNDAIAEGTETVTMNIVPLPGTYGSRVSGATYLLGDNDSGTLPSVRFGTSTSSGGEAVSTVNLPVTLSVASTGIVTVNYAISGGSATGRGVDYGFTNGVLQFDPGVTSLNIPFAVIDDIFSEPNETVVIALSSPNGASLGTSTHTYTITDNDATPLPTVGFAGTASSALESVNSPPSVVVSVSSPATAAITVDYAVTGGSASSGSDYTIANGTVTFAVGNVARALPLVIVDDALAESNETIVITLSNATGATLGANAVHTFTIVDNDASTITVAAADDAAAETGDPGAFTLTRSGSTSGTLSVGIAVGGTATNGADYQSLSSTVNFANGQSIATLAVVPYHDAIAEGNETVTVSLLPGAGYSPGNVATATVNIRENSTIVGIVASDDTASEGGLDQGTFTITRSGDTTAALNVNLTLSGTASANTDYTPPSLPVQIAAGASSTTVSIAPVDDDETEETETVIATIAPSSEYTVSGSSLAMLSILDNDFNAAPVIARVSPAKSAIGLPSGTGLILEATVADDGRPKSPGGVTTVWTRQSGPGAVTFGTPDRPSTTARFSANGNYLLRLTANDGELSSLLEISVSVGGAPTFTGLDVNGSSPSGSFTVDAGTYTVLAGGSDISGSSDEFFFLHQPLTGDGEIRARIVSITGGLSSAKAGVMFRENLTAGARTAYMSSYGPASTTNANSFRTRAAEEAAIGDTGIAGAPVYPTWVRVVRSGDSFSGYTSGDGLTWAQIGSTAQLSTDAQLLAGLAVTSNDSSSLCTAIFDNVTISTWPTNLGVAVEAGPDVTAVVAENASLKGTANDDGKPPSVGAFTLLWSKVSGPGLVTFGTKSSAATTAVLSETGSYVLRLVADDGEVKTYDEVSVTGVAGSVTVTASDATAEEAGPANGAFTIARTGSTAEPLTIHFTTSGTATNGLDYLPLPQTAIIDAGQSTTTLTVTPVADALAEGPETVELTLRSDPAYVVGTRPTASITLEDLPSDSWKFGSFGSDANNSLITDDLADPDGDGFCNLLERAQGTSPTIMDSTGPEFGFEPGFLTLTYRRSLSATDLKFTVLESSDFATWEPANAAEEILSDDGEIRVIKSRVPRGTGDQKLIRLRIQRDE